MSNVRVRDFEMGFDDDGTGIPVVFVHGFPLDRALWIHQRSALSSSARCIVPDLRGFGESTGAASSMGTYADDLVALLDHLDIPSAVFCGLSMGGYICMELWRAHPDRVRGLAFCDTRHTADSEEQRTTRNELIEKTKEHGPQVVVDAQIDSLIAPSTRERRKDIVETLNAMILRQSVEGIVGALKAMSARPDSTETLKSVTVPTMVIVGEQDQITPPASAQAMFDLLPLSARPRIERVAGAGHVSCLERPAAVNHAISDFLATVESE